MKELQHYAELANKILSGATKYQADKNIISSVFRLSSGKNTNDDVVFRLTVIDSYYSTQLSKRYFGIEEIAKKINEISKNDDVMAELFIEYLEKGNDKIQKLFKDQYGIRKNGKKAGMAQSLISKYAYFLTDFKFPIYDNLARSSFTKIREAYSGLMLNKLSDGNFFKEIKKLNENSGILDYDKLDNLLWLIGKMTEGSFSLILSKDKYLELINRIDLPDKLDSREADKKIREYIIGHTNSLGDIFNKETVDFIKFCFSKNTRT